MHSPLLNPDLEDAGLSSGRWMVVIYNNETTSMDAVVSILMKATGCDYEEAFIEMWEAHTFGKAPVHFSGQSECEEVAVVIRTAGIKTEVMKEWND